MFTVVSDCGPKSTCPLSFSHFRGLVHHPLDDVTPINLQCDVVVFHRFSSLRVRVLLRLQDIQSPNRVEWLEGMGMSEGQYLHIMSPSVSWLMGIVGKGAGKDIFGEIFSSYKANCGNSMVLKNIIEVGVCVTCSLCVILYDCVL